MGIDVEKWKEIFDTIKQHKLRTGLTAFGVFWGIFMLVVLLGAGNGLRNAVFRNFDIAKNTVFIWTMQTSKPYKGFKPGRYIQLKNDDIASIRRNIPEVGVIAARTPLRGEFAIERGTKSVSFNVMGDYPEFVKVKPILLTSGRFINDIDIDNKRKVATIGRRVVEVLFTPDEDPVGQYIYISGISFMVIGVFDTKLAGEEAIEDVQTIFIPNTTLQQTFGRPNQVGWFALIPNEGVPATIVEEKVKTLLAENHNVDPTDERAFGVANIEEEYKQVQGLFIGIKVFTWLVSIGTIIAGVVGVGNIMLIIVKERTKEIGIRKSLGATPWSIISMIVQESLLITGAAGYLGLLTGVALVEGIRYLMMSNGVEIEFFYNPEIDFQVAGSALLLLVVSGTLAGIVPGSKAARVDPVVALRDE